MNHVVVAAAAAAVAADLDGVEMNYLPVYVGNDLLEAVAAAFGKNCFLAFAGTVLPVSIVDYYLHFFAVGSYSQSVSIAFGFVLYCYCSAVAFY